MSARLFLVLATALLLCLGVLLWALTRPQLAVLQTATFHAVDFDDLPGWAADDHAAAVPAFRLSCARMARWQDDRPLTTDGAGGRAADWRAACAALDNVPADDAAAARDYFETHFQPHAVRFAGSEDGLFTGYYEPLLHGSPIADASFRVPLYARPGDLVTVDLSAFADDLAGRRLVGRVDGGRLLPYPTRAEIDGGYLDGRGAELLYVDDPVDAFFLHIQGSGRVRLPDGREVRVGFAAKNGQPYFAIGRALIDRGVLTRGSVSMQSIRAWLEANPDEAAALMQQNPSYVFFRLLDGPGPLGSLGVPLTPGRSIAVDRRLIPLGAPVWLDAAQPGAASGAADRPLRRLMVAQDTGGAINGGVRGDVFWGAGAEAEHVAGHMKHPGRWFLLLPKPQPAS